MERKKALSLFDGVVSPELLDFMERQVNLSKYRVRVEGMILTFKPGPFLCTTLMERLIGSWQSYSTYHQNGHLLKWYRGLHQMMISLIVTQM